MIDLQTFTGIDSAINKIAAYENNSNKEYPFNVPMLNQPNEKTCMEKQTSTIKEDSLKIATARSYDMSDGIIQESYSQLEQSDDSANVLSDTELNPSNDLIIVLSDYLGSDELVNLYNKFKNRIKVIVYYGNNASLKNIFDPYTKIISAKSLKKAVNKSYLLLQNGQSILFPRISNNFDFFSHIDFA